ncbi:MAG: serine/threonine protein kinase [Anaerolineae bacterium]|nr:serine/threonine protein kinase [Anaerolineae bacterium]
MSTNRRMVMNDDLIGGAVGPYELVDRLGTGGMAGVYLARLPGDGQAALAIKVLALRSTDRAAQRQRFLREAQMTSRLRHPHILPVYDYGESSGKLYLVMKLIHGGTLAERIARGPLEPGEVAAILTQVAGALDYAHARGVIHRDIKPQNILFDAGGDAYLSDFGIAQPGDSAGAEEAPGFTGTVAYASPEQCRGEELTPTSDLYTLGVVVYEMLTGTLPFQGSTPLAVMRQHLTGPVPDPRAANPALPPGVTAVLDKALAKRPSARYRSAASFSGALNRALYSHSQPEQPSVERIALAASAQPVRPPGPMPDALRLRVTRRLLAVVALLLALAMVAAALILTFAR